MTTRRDFLSAAAAVPAALLATRSGFAAPPAPAAASAAANPPDAASVAPIGTAEREARIAKVQALMHDQRVAALVIEPGATLEYFTGIEWRRSERTTAAVIPARGQPFVVTPAFEEPSVRESLKVSAEVRPWNEHENPFERIVGGLRDRGIKRGVVAVEPTVRYFVVDGIRRVSHSYRLESGDALVRACRLIKSPAELALMQVANDITLAALRKTHAAVRSGMRPVDLAELVNAATVALGGKPEFALVLLNEASAYPHGSVQPQEVREGSVILMDCGCTVHGYQSDITRTWVYGEANARQRTVWSTVKRGQEIVLENARLGVAVGTLDDAVRHFYESRGFGPGYKLPGLPHRAGHGIGLDGHEPPYLVHGDETPLAAGMCFSDEPGLYVPGEFGVRLEDCWHMTAEGPRSFTPLARSLDAPI